MEKSFGEFKFAKKEEQKEFEKIPKGEQEMAKKIFQEKKKEMKGEVEQKFIEKQEKEMNEIFDIYEKWIDTKPSCGCEICFEKDTKKNPEELRTKIKKLYRTCLLERL